jgi:uncharacterized protein YraI
MEIEMMTKNFLLLLFITVACIFLAACGMSQEELDVEATKIVAEIYGTQTAQVPTNTLTPSLTNTPLATSTLTYTITPSKTTRPTNTPRPTRTSTPRYTATPTPNPFAVVDTESLNIRKGPGVVYAIVTGAARGEHLEIVGQAYSCSWLKIKTTNGVEGWVSVDLIDYDLPCNQIPSAPVPPTPIPVPSSTPTKQAPAAKTIRVKIINDTGGYITINLNGPAVYSFSFPPGNSDMWVIPGTYNYTTWGCGTSASGTQKLSEGFEWKWYCQ